MPALALATRAAFSSSDRLAHASLPLRLASARCSGVIATCLLFALDFSMRAAFSSSESEFHASLPRWLRIARSSAVKKCRFCHGVNPPIVLLFYFSIINWGFGADEVNPVWKNH